MGSLGTGGFDTRHAPLMLGPDPGEETEMIRTLMFKTIANWEAARNGREIAVPGPLVPVELKPDDRGSYLFALYDLLGCETVEEVVVDARVAARLIVDEEASFDALAVPNRRFSYANRNGSILTNAFVISKPAVIVGSDGESWCTPSLAEAMAIYDLAVDVAPDTLPRSALADRWGAWLTAGKSWL